MRYHLLFQALLKETDIEHGAKELIEATRYSMCEVCDFLNKSQHDQENLTKIEKIMTQMAVEIK